MTKHLKKKPKQIPLDFIIDKLTNSIENVITGDSFHTDVSVLNKDELKLLKKKEWQFDWKQETNDSTKTVYKLTITENPKIIQGVISIEDRGDHILCILLKVQNSIRASIRFMWVYQGI